MRKGVFWARRKWSLLCALSSVQMASPLPHSKYQNCLWINARICIQAPDATMYPGRASFRLRPRAPKLTGCQIPHFLNHSKVPYQVYLWTGITHWGIFGDDAVTQVSFFCLPCFLMDIHIPFPQHTQYITAFFLGGGEPWFEKKHLKNVFVLYGEMSTRLKITKWLSYYS